MGVGVAPPPSAFSVRVASTRPAPQPPEHTPGIARALVLSVDSTWDGVREEFFASISATVPATCGVAIEVPLYFV
ncbi:hypothetical protein MIFL109517_11035 [Micrococcus flavus]